MYYNVSGERCKGKIHSPVSLGPASAITSGGNSSSSSSTQRSITHHAILCFWNKRNQSVSVIIKSSRIFAAELPRRRTCSNLFPTLIFSRCYLALGIFRQRLLSDWPINYHNRLLSPPTTRSLNVIESVSASFFERSIDQDENTGRQAHQAWWRRTKIIIILLSDIPSN